MRSGYRHPLSILKFATILLTATALVPASALARKPAKTSEIHELSHDPKTSVTVDETALGAKKKAIATLEALLKQKNAPASEPSILLRLIELLHDSSAIAFRISHARAELAGSKAHLEEYSKLQAKANHYSSRMIQNYPDHKGIARVYYLRAKALKELGQKEGAIKDYKHFIENFPRAEEAPLAMLALCDLLIEQRSFQDALPYLRTLLNIKDKAFYPIALDRTAWVHYYTGDIGTALKYIRMKADYLRNADGTGTGKISERDQALSTMVLFYSSGIDAALDGYNVSKALALFRSTATDAELGKMLVRFAYILRSKANNPRIEELKHAVGKRDLGRTDTVELLKTIFEHELNQKLYADCKDSAYRLFNLVAGEYGCSAKDTRCLSIRGLFVDSAGVVQGYLSQPQSPQTAEAMAQTLVTLYELALKIPSPDSQTEAKMRFNLAGTLLMLKRYENAAVHYRIVAEKKDPLSDSARLKALAAGYEDLKEKKLIPTDLKASPLSTDSRTDFPKAVSDWISWVDRYAKSSQPTYDFYRYESARLTYAYGDIPEAMKRLQDIVSQKQALDPKNDQKTPAASLIIDTYIASQKWLDTYEFASTLIKRGDWKKTPFQEKLLTVAGDAFFKTVEEAYKTEEYKNAISRSEEFLSQFLQNKHRTEAIVISANAALKLNDRALAQKQFDKVIGAKDLKPEMLATALFTRASVAEENYDFTTAAREYNRYLALPLQNRGTEGQDTQLRKKLLYLAWSSGSEPEFQSVLASPRICEDEQKRLCEELRTLYRLQSRKKPITPQESAKAERLAIQNKGTLSLIWSAIALENPSTLQQRERLKLLQLVSDRWNTDDPLISYTLMPFLSISVPRAIEVSRKHIDKSDRIVLNKTALKKRTEDIEQVVDTADKVSRLPWTGIRIALSNELANLYDDFAAGLRRLPPPKGLRPEEKAAYDQTIAELVQPFLERRNEFRRKAFELAVNKPADELILVPLIERFLAENADQKASLTNGRTFIVVPQNAAQIARDLALAVQSDKKAPPAFAKGIQEAISQSNWPKIALLIQNAGEKELVAPATLNMLKAASFALAGARSECLEILAKNLEELDSNDRPLALVPLALGYFSAFNAAQTKSHMEEFLSDKGYRAEFLRNRENEASALIDAAKWSKLQVPDELAALASRTRTPAGVRRR